ncbi:hypothetical protein [Ornithinibacillus bavariensis]|uniref:hypothetical protein n=1 Tax=Ornithinibacillus bavariensis TaxID=545502 RepID=UPI000EDF4D1A|nr:hypothetical protein [Ornithinibacillus sp.]
MNEQERLEEVKEAIAHQLGLTDSWVDGTYLYHLTRSKSAFSVGTMTLNDFTEIDEELLDDIFEAVKPFLIHQAEEKIQLEERVKELELDRDDWKEEAMKRSRRWEQSEEEHRETNELLISTVKQNQRYKQAIEAGIGIAKGNVLACPACSDIEIILNKALQGDTNA